jgi:hypothetical protein
MSTSSQIAVRQLDRGMDLGPAHKNIALNHLVARGIPMPEDISDRILVAGDEDDNPSAWYRARKAERRAITPVPTPEPTPEPITPVPESPIVEEPGARRRRMNPLWVVGTDGITYSSASSPERLEEIHAAWEERLRVFNARTTYIRDEISGFTTEMTRFYSDSVEAPRLSDQEMALRALNVR